MQYIHALSITIGVGVNAIHPRPSLALLLPSATIDRSIDRSRFSRAQAKLREQGWAIDEITPKTHRDYWTASDEARGRAVRVGVARAGRRRNWRAGRIPPRRSTAKRREGSWAEAGRAVVARLRSGDFPPKRLVAPFCTSSFFI